MNIPRPLGLKGLLLAAAILPGPMILATPMSASAQVSIGVSVQLAPPPLLVYAQPPMPEEGYIWTPGYWQWDASAGYYWIPGTWILPPVADVLWTPPYWGWSDGVYLFHGGYWGPHVGYYGGVNYGYGYGGVGYGGGRWDGGHFAYNQSVNNFGSVRVGHTYRQNVTINTNSHVSYAGGAGGIRSEPNAAERGAEHENHMPVTSEQARHVSAAAANPALAANHGRPATAATARPGQFVGEGIVRPLAAPMRAAPVHAAIPGAAEHQQPARVPEPQARQEAPRPEAARAPEPRQATPQPEARPAQQHQEAPRPEAARAPEQRQAAPRPEARPAQMHQEAPRPEAARAPEQRQAAPRPEARPEQQHQEAPHEEKRREG